MMNSKRLLGLLGTLAICTPILAQQPPDNGPGPGPGPDQSQGEPPHPRGGGMEQMLDRLKDDLQATDDQWTTVSPKVRTILQLEHELYSGGPPGGGPPGGGPNGGGPPGGGPDGGGPNGGGGGANGGGANGGGNGGPPDNGPPAGGPPNGGANAMVDPNAPPVDANATTRPAPTLSAEAEGVRKAKRELEHLIHDPDATDAEIISAGKELRDARADAKTALTAAQADLKPRVNERQQAILMSFGILD